MSHLRSTAAVIATGLVLASCTGSSSARSARGARPRVTTTTVVRVVRGQSLALHAMAYLTSNPSTPVIGLFARGPAAVVVGAPTEVLVQLRVGAAPVWAGIPARRSIVAAHDGSGRIGVATDGCPPSSAASCAARLVYAPTAFPIGPPPAGGIVTDRGFALHLATSAVQPGRYEMTFPIRYASNISRTNVLDVVDTLHVRLDVGSQAPSTRCTVADLHRPRHTMPTPHALTSTIAFVPGDERLDPPPHGAKPRIPATVAWQHLASHTGGSGGSSSLVLALLTTTTPARRLANGTYAEETHDVLAWVLYTHDLAVAGGLIDHGPIGPREHPPVSSSPCQLLDGLDAMNATTGQELLSRGGTAEHDPIQF